MFFIIIIIIIIIIREENRDMNSLLDNMVFII